MIVRRVVKEDRQLVHRSHPCQEVVGNPLVFAVGHICESKNPVNEPFVLCTTSRTVRGALTLLHAAGWQRGLEQTIRRGSAHPDWNPKVESGEFLYVTLQGSMDSG